MIFYSYHDEKLGMKYTFYPICHDNLYFEYCIYFQLHNKCNGIKKKKKEKEKKKWLPYQILDITTNIKILLTCHS